MGSICIPLRITIIIEVMVAIRINPISMLVDRLHAKRSQGKVRFWVENEKHEAATDHYFGIACAWYSARRCVSGMRANSKSLSPVRSWVPVAAMQYCIPCCAICMLFYR